jgi:hypothetical protein
MGDKSLGERVLDLEQTVAGIKVVTEAAKPMPVEGKETVDTVAILKSMSGLMKMIDSLAGSHVELIEVVKGLRAEIGSAGRSKPRGRKKA